MERRLRRRFVDGIVSLGEGMMSIFGGFFSLQPFSYEEHFGSDAERLASDWQRVGDDLRSATNQFEKEMENNSK